MLFEEDGVAYQPPQVPQGFVQAAAPSASQSRRCPFVQIIEQPASQVRYRYESEEKYAQIIQGISSTPEKKTFPAIQVVGYRGRAKVVVSCVTEDEPYRSHPHSLVIGKDSKVGICVVEIPMDTMRVQFTNLHIRCVKKRDIGQALKYREEKQIDPFQTGFDHRNKPSSINLHAVRLCFQVFLKDTTGRFSIPLSPIVSEPVNHKRVPDPKIFRLSNCVSPADGGKEYIILLCEKITDDDIQIRFFEKEGWEAFAEIRQKQIHKHYAICFRPPRYKTQMINEPVRVFVQLLRPSDGETSEPLPFEYLPILECRKPKKTKDFSEFLRGLQELDTTDRLAVKPPMDFTPMEIRAADRLSSKPPIDYIPMETRGFPTGLEEFLKLPPYHQGTSNASGNSATNFEPFPQCVPQQPTYLAEMMHDNPEGTRSTYHPQIRQSPSENIFPLSAWTSVLLNDFSSLPAPSAEMQVASISTAGVATASNNGQALLSVDDVNQVNSDEIHELAADVELKEISGELFSTSDVILLQQEDSHMRV